MSHDEPGAAASRAADGADGSRAVPPPPPRSSLPAAATLPTAREIHDEPGRLTRQWRVVVAFTWVAVAAAWAGVWNASVQIGLSTWWLGPRGDPQPAIVRLLPFLVAGCVVVAALNRVRLTPWLGIAGALVLGAFAVGDIGRVDRLALVEGVIALAAGLVSAASLSGRWQSNR